MLNTAKVLIVDIETSPIIAMVWGLGKQYLSQENMLEDWYIMSFSAKWLGDPASRMVYMEARDRNDKPLLKKLWELFNEADIVVTQNGQKFDEPKIKARMMLQGFKPYKPFLHHDTYLQNSDKEFTSHSLAYLTSKFCTKYKKLKHKEFPGFSLWRECRGGNPKAWAEMRKYNNYDTLSTEELYLNTRGWSKKKAPSILTGDIEERQCRYCGEFRCTKEGLDRTVKKVFIRLQCQACGKWSRGKEVTL